MMKNLLKKMILIKLYFMLIKLYLQKRFHQMNYYVRHTLRGKLTGALKIILKYFDLIKQLKYKMIII